MILELIIGVVLLGVAVTAVLAAAGGRRLRTSQRLSTIHHYGFAGDPVPAVFHDDVASNGISDLVTRVGNVVASRLGRASEDNLRAELMTAGMYRVSPRTLL